MFVTLSIVLVWILSVASATTFRPRDSTPYSNATSITTSDALVLSPSSSSEASSTTRQPPYPIHGSGSITSEHVYPRPTDQASTKPSASTNSTNITTTDPSCTVNIPSANLEWWYAATYESAVGTLMENAANFTNEGGYFTLIPNTATLDLSSAISTDTAWTESVSYESEWDVYWTVLEAYTVIPTAASTSIITQNAAVPLPSGNIIPSSDYTLYELPVTDLPPPSVPIAGVANFTTAITSATPFVYFTAYEVEEAVNESATTRTIALAQPFAFEYQVKGMESSATATGPVPDEFLQRIPESSCRPGTVQGEVTVLVVVNLFYFHLPHANPFIVHFESTALGWDDPTVVAQDTSKGAPFTMNLDPQPTKTVGAKTTTKTTEGKPGAQQASPSGHSAGSNLPDVQQPTSQTVGTIGTNPVVVGPSSVVVVGSQTLTPGGPAVTIGGSSISVAPSATAIVVGGQTSALPIVANPGSPSQTVGTVGGMPVVVGPSSTVVIGGQTLQPGGSPVTIGGNPVSLAPSATAIVVGTKTSSLPQVIFPGDTTQTQAPAPPVLTIGSSTLTANAATQFFVSPGQTLTPGGTATVEGTVVSLGPSASFIVIGGSTQILASPGATAQPEIIGGGSTITALPGSPNNRQGVDSNGNSGPTFVVFGQALAPGHAITVDGTTISLALSGSFVVINGVTSTLPTAAAAQITAPPLTIGNGVFTALSGTGTSYMIGTVILTPGGIITVAGTTISLAPGATAVVVNGVTTTLSPQAMITNPPLLTIGSHAYTAAPGTGTTFIINGQTLTPGGTITVDGTTISLAPEATELIYGSSGQSTTAALFPATTTRSQSITGFLSGPASAGASGTSGDAAATTSSRDAGSSIQMPAIESWMLSLIMGVLGLWVR